MRQDFAPVHIALAKVPVIARSQVIDVIYPMLEIIETLLNRIERLEAAQNAKG